MSIAENQAAPSGAATSWEPGANREVAASDDAAIIRFIDALPHDLIWSERAARVVAVFGPATGWTAERIMAHTRDRFGGARAKIVRDGEVLAFVNDRIGVLTIDALVAACVERFGAARAPSRSALHRHSQMLSGRLATRRK